MSPTDYPPLPSLDWDVLITGSGLKHSLLAVALGRAGKSVLQIDKNGYYGGASTAFYSLPELTAWASRVNAGLEPGFSSAVVSCDGGELGRGHTLSLAPDLVYWNSELLRVLRGADMADSVSWQAVGSWWVFLTDEELAVPAPAAAGGGSGSGMLMGAGVKAVKAVAEGKKRWNKGRKKKEEEETVAEGSATTTGAAAATQPQLPEEEEEGATTLRKMGNFREVACTFEDVAWSKDLSDRDRGHLGEFLRFVMKHDSNDPSDQKHLNIFTANKETTLQTFLSTTFPLPPSAITSLSSLTLLPTGPSLTPLSLAVPALARHFRSLGNIPEARSAAALTIAYGGSAELCQVLSRAAAVAGAVNVLSRGIATITPAAQAETEPENGGAPPPRRRHRVALDNGEEIGADWIIGAPEDLPVPTATAAATTTEGGEEGESTQTQTLSKAAYVLSGELPDLFVKKYADEGVTPAAAVLMVPVVGEDGGEMVPVYILARSSVTGECPRGYTLLYATTTLPHTAIHTAVRRLLETQTPPPPPPLLSLLYTTTTTAATAAATSRPGIISLTPVTPSMAFDDTVLSEARARFATIVGTEEEGGFMKLPEEAKRLLEEMEDA